MDEPRERVERFVREHDLIPSGGDVTCLVSGGADSTCLWHLLGSLGYRVSALHVNHELRADDSDEDARFCAEALGAEVVERDGRGLSEAGLREQRLSLARLSLRATGHTASDQVETILYRLVSRGAATGIAPRSAEGIVHPLLPLWREETEAYCRDAGLEFRVDPSNADTKRGLIRDEILPLLRRLHPAADDNLLRALDTRATLPPALAELLAAPVGSKRVDLGGGVQAVREHERLWLERGPVERAQDVLVRGRMDPPQQRQDLLADQAANRVAVRTVVAIRKALRLAVAARFLAPDAEERADDTVVALRPDALGAAARHKPVDDRLDLVGERVAGRAQPVGRKPVTDAPQLVLRRAAVAVDDLRTEDVPAEAGVRIRLGAPEAVVDVQSRDLVPEPPQNVPEARRVGTARDQDRHRRARNEQALVPNERLDAARDRLFRHR